ncbi:hypothetical protein HPB51_019398 [Rhipicephalus microplus]|uniref:Uncharacterized protein n=1 Tax=Rhipicephalus microplus TaxID=6941 RepID=A0A9J6DBU3_RHIMP|nr:hypothetical protein HPB51_019398 [Rhipicephalus microplus]
MACSATGAHLGQFPLCRAHGARTSCKVAEDSRHTRVHKEHHSHGTASARRPATNKQDGARRERTLARAEEKTTDGRGSLGPAPGLQRFESPIPTSASCHLCDPVVQQAGGAVSSRKRSEITPTTLNEPVLADTRLPRQRRTGQRGLGGGRSASRHHFHHRMATTSVYVASFTERLSTPEGTRRTRSETVGCERHR